MYSPTQKKLISCGKVPRMKLGCVVRLPQRLIFRQPGSQCGPSRKGLDLSHLVPSVTKSVIRAVSINPRRGGAYVPARAPGVHHRVRLEADDDCRRARSAGGEGGERLPIGRERRRRRRRRWRWTEGGRKGRGRRTY